MLSIGSYELILIVILVLILVKPEDLPALLERLGRFYSRLRDYFINIRSELSTSISDIKEAKEELEKEIKENFDVEKELEKLSKGFDSVKTQEIIEKSNTKDPSLNLEVEEDEKEVQEELKLSEENNNEKK